MSSGHLSPARQARFWAKVIKLSADECWPWRGACGGFGHGVFWDGERMDGAHRFAYRLAFGAIPEGKLVRHRCDVPGCVNPAHLEPGTHADNARDKVERGRHRPARGERSGHAKLTEVQAREIKRRAAAGERNSPLAREFGVSPPTVRLLVLGRKWAHLTD